MSENGNKIKTEKKGRREAQERRPPRNYIRCDLLPETPFSAELPPPALRALRRFQRLNFRLEKNEDSSSVASAAGDAASWECGTAHHCPTPPGSLPGTWVPQAQPGSPDAQRVAGQRQSQVQGGGQHVALGRARRRVSSHLQGLQGPRDICRHRAGGVLQSPGPSLKIPGLGNQLAVLHSRSKSTDSA